MNAIRTIQDGPYTVYELREASTDSWLKVAPERGGIIIGFGSGGVELFYLDRETFLDPAANIRGGNPILFPISGQLANGEYRWNGRTYKMKNHGLARTAAWEVTDVREGEAGSPSITIRLASTEDMLESYPFSFELVFTYTLKGGTLFIDQEYRNLSEEEMPVYPGFHPYFRTGGKAIRYETDATEYLDYNDMRIKAFEGVVDLDTLTESVVLLDARTPRIAFELPGVSRKVTMEYGEDFRYVVLWSVAGKDFVCVEPWMSKTGELNRGEELVRVKPGGTLRTQLAIRSEPV